MLFSSARDRRAVFSFHSCELSLAVVPNFHPKEEHMIFL
jgi:hypothetical protein